MSAKSKWHVPSGGVWARLLWTASSAIFDGHSGQLLLLGANGRSSVIELPARARGVYANGWIITLLWWTYSNSCKKDKLHLSLIVGNTLEENRIYFPSKKLQLCSCLWRGSLQQ